MALLVRVAQTRQGSERLLDARIFGLLAHCEFLEARPQNDHAFLGNWIRPFNTLTPLY